MRRPARVMAPLALFLSLGTLTNGCSEAKTKSIPEIPNQFCWNAFDRTAVQPLLPQGDKLSQEIDPFQFAEHNSSTSCILYVDGNYGFRAFADFEDEEDFIDWSSWAARKPDSVRTGVKGIAWDTGAASYVPCRPLPGAGPSTGKFVELRIHVTDAGGKNAREALPGLLKQFTAFAQKELKCG
ncbi:hypothetical protein ACFWRV_09580 [Streptomyces sp. NPDC058576]|uniref:hypothetical protein n=1 Tax=Streptomyces sp. NPDC058576 TaxID=3346547 RepID=UPI0036656E04